MSASGSLYKLTKSVCVVHAHGCFIII
uniref:Uncharacterized protein n=1 Tax=Anguilla anguilla TaxID=7936 RepID=A0A0E9V7L8_ANGAN